MTLDRYLVANIATEHQLDPLLLEALVMQESGGNPWAIRPEPRFPYFVNCKTGKPFRATTPDERASKIAPPDFPYFAGGREQEWWLQQCSLGLTQIMGAVAREQGFRGPYLLELTEPSLNLGLGAALLRSHLTWAGGSEAYALGAFNAGRGNASGEAGRAYGAKVLARYAGLKGGHA